MGITGELVRSVFSKSRSVGAHESNVRSNAGEKRRWSSVRSYLCGDELNSAIAEEDSASVRSTRAATTQPELSSVLLEEDTASANNSEATVTQPIIENFTEKGEIQSKETNEETQEERQNSTAKLFRKDDAAIVIQSAFRGPMKKHKRKSRIQRQNCFEKMMQQLSSSRHLEAFWSIHTAKRRNEGIKLVDAAQELGVEIGSPSRVSIGTSIAVQTANSAVAFSLREESFAVPPRLPPRARTQVLKLQEDWDDSTLCSSISEMRIQHRLEAATRRERALAYAFAQQLRICSKKKQTKSDGTDPNMGWSWLERWMATRQPENFLIENYISKQLEPLHTNQRQGIRRSSFDITKKENESCGSNEVSVQFDSISIIAPEDRDKLRPSKNRLKVSKKICARDDEIAKKQKTKQAGSKREMKCKDATSQVSPDM
ncbi:unnamed protein product [Ilex paraguariensis]|uniref:Protein IQ-DOMAIN 1 n=1 Tax=Ilex paraguariensis TaxID=185542 RepID=A0ABC8QME3_9AQUA